MHAASGRSPASVGFPSRIRNPYEHPCHYLSTHYPERRDSAASLVRHLPSLFAPPSPRFMLADHRPMKLLRKLPPLNSRKVIALSVSFLRKIPQDVYALLASHAWDDSVGTKVDQLHA